MGSRKNKHEVKINKNQDKKIDKNSVFSQNQCVIHLIRTSKDDNSLNDEALHETEFIIKFITDNHIELWNMMKRGDLVEDISTSGYRSQGRYIVDKELNQPDHIKLIRNGLTIKDLCSDFDDYGSILPNMYTFTEFPRHYFDDENLLVNNVFYPNEEIKSYWHWSNSEYNLICLDVKKLKLNTITDDNVFHFTKDIVKGKGKYKVHYLYVVVTYKKVKYLFISEYSEQYSVQNIEKITKDFIKKFQETMFTETDYDNSVKKIAQIENVEFDNIVMIC
jgi:hypothetical protein